MELNELNHSDYLFDGGNTLCIFGDSLTNGTGSSYTFAQMIPWGTGKNILINSRGYGGQTYKQIAMRQGSSPIFLTLSGNALNGATPVSVTAINGIAPATSTAPLSALSGNYTIQNSGTIEGTQVILTRTATGSSVPFTETYTLTAAAGDTTAIPAGAQFYPDYALNGRSEINLFWWGRNNVGGNLSGLDTALIAAVNYLDSPKRFLVVGVLPSLSDINGTANKAEIDNENALLLGLFPLNFIPSTPPTVNELVSIAYTPTTQDNIDIANGVFPTGLHYDSVHLNELGYKIFSLRCRNLMMQYGWL